MININLSNKSPENIQQKFSFYTEEIWANEKQKFSKNLDTVFSAKKDETFILLDTDIVHYLIGLGSEAKLFEIQARAEKFTYDFRKKIKSESTILNSENFSSA